MTKEEIITKAQLYLDDSSELSTAEFSDLFDKMYRKVNTNRIWEGTKKEGSGTTSTSVAYVALASDFLSLVANNNYADSNEYANRPVIFRGANYTPYKVISWSDRRQYRNTDGYAFIDWANQRVEFTKQPTVAEAIEYDYQASMPELANAESPWFPEEFHDVLYHYMVADDFVLQHSDKAKSYANENIAMGDKILERMIMWNARLVQN